MAGLIGVKLMWQDIAARSWSERYYHVTANTLNDAYPDIGSMIKARVLLCGAGVKLKRVIYSSDLANGDSYSYKPLPAFFYPDIQLYNSVFKTETVDNKTEGAKADNSFVALLLRKEMQGDHRAMSYLSGVPDAATVLGLDTPQSVEFNDKFKKWRTIMLSGKWGSKVIDTGVGNPEKNITAMAADYSLITSTAHGLAAGNKIKISGSFGSDLLGDRVRILKGVRTVDKVVSADTFTVELTDCDPSLESVVNFGKFRKQVPVVVAYTQISIEEVVSHKRGNSLFRKRGRSRGCKAC